MSSSICSRIKMRNFSKSITNGFAYRNAFHGCVPKQMLHYCTYNLENDRPDVVIIHVGSNALGRDVNSTIANDIIDIVTMCQKYGVNEVFVSEITYRPKFENDINEINNILHGKSLLHNFQVISNSNINGMHLWIDNLHLNDHGTNILTSNYTRAINGVRY